MGLVVGDMRLLRLITKALKEFFMTNRPFVTIVITPMGDAEVHSNMDNQHERIQLVEQTLKTMKALAGMN